MLDRDTYGSDSTIHVFIADQAANLNPTVPDKFTVDQNKLKSLFSLSGGTFNVKDNITFTETGPNTAIFEGTFTLGDDINATAKSLVLTLHDKANYDDVTSPENDNLTGISKVSFDIEDTDGKLNVPDFITFRSGLKISLTDFDQNKDSEIADTIKGRLNIAIEGNGSDSQTVNLKETEANSGIFVIDNSKNEIPVSFTTGNTTKNNNDGVLKFTSRDIHNNIKVTYFDPSNHDGKPETFIVRAKLHTTPATLTLPTSVGINGQFVLSINSPDLNDNPQSKDSYTFTPVSGRPVPLVRGYTQLGDFAQIEIQIEGTDNNTSIASSSSKTFTLVETGLDTGIFEANIGTKDLANGLGHPLKVGDRVKITYFDNMETPRHAASAVMNII
jgi:hypothetical protein